MSSFKDKPLKKCHTDKRKMIDDIHNSLIQEGSINKNEYYLDNGLLLDQYYKEDTQIKKGSNDGILSYFMSKNKDNSDCDNSKKELINDYMCNIDDTVSNSKYKDILDDKCPSCNQIMSFSNETSELICSSCGRTKDIMVVTEKGSFNDPHREVSYFAYKRINHFNEWLAQFQGKEKTELEDQVFHDIYAELKKHKELDITKINYKQVRDILKKLKYNKYYEHIPYLISVISGQRAPSLDRRSEELLRALFKEIQIPFMNNCPASRKNFLSYSYVLHKFCELLELDHLLIYFPLLKSREKLHQQDQIWEKICKDLKWQYIPSI